MPHSTPSQETWLGNHRSFFLLLFNMLYKIIIWVTIKLLFAIILSAVKLLFEYPWMNQLYKQCPQYSFHVYWIITLTYTHNKNSKYQITEISEVCHLFHFTSSTQMSHSYTTLRLLPNRFPLFFLWSANPGYPSVVVNRISVNTHQ